MPRSTLYMPTCTRSQAAEQVDDVSARSDPNSTEIINPECCGSVWGLRLQKAVGDGVGGHGCRRAQTQFAHEVGAVLFNGLVAQRKHASHLPRTVAACNE